MVEEWSCLQARVYFRKEVTLIICLLIDLKTRIKEKENVRNGLSFWMVHNSFKKCPHDLGVPILYIDLVSCAHHPIIHPSLI